MRGDAQAEWPSALGGGGRTVTARGPRAAQGSGRNAKERPRRATGPRPDGLEAMLLKQIAETEERLMLLRMRLDQLYRGRRKMITIVTPHSAPPQPLPNNAPKAHPAPTRTAKRTRTKRRRPASRSARLARSA